MASPQNAQRPCVVIIGGGFAGLNAAKALHRAPVDVIVIDRNNYHLFQPLLYQVATAGLSDNDIASPIRGILRRQRNTQVMLAHVTGIDTDAQVVTLDYGEVHYDYLIVATGMENNYFGEDHWQDFAPALKTMNDALECRRRMLTAFEQAERASDRDEIQALLTFVIVGAGPTGVELAGAIREISYQVMIHDFRRIDPAHACVVLLDAGSRVLSSYDEKLSARALHDLEQRGIEVRLNSMVRDVREDGVVTDDAFIAARTVIWAAGVKASPIASFLNSPLDRLGRVIVRKNLTLPDRDNVFVIGDLAHFAHTDAQAPLPGLAPVAIQQGKWVGKAIRKHAATGELSELRNAIFRYRDRGQMATIGRASAIAQLGRLRLGGFVAWVLWLFVHIMFLIGFRNRLMVLLDWAYAYIGFRRGARLIIDNDSAEDTTNKRLFPGQASTHSPQAPAE